MQTLRSSFLDNQCDLVQSPIVRLAADSTMTLFNNCNIEIFNGGQSHPPPGRQGGSGAFSCAGSVYPWVG